MSTHFKVICYLVLLRTLLTDAKPNDDETTSESLPENEDESDLEIGVRTDFYPTYKQKGYSPQSACRDPNFLPGRCLKLADCPGLLELATKLKSPNYKKLQYSHCGTFANTQHFCCNMKQIVTTPRPSTTIRTTAPMRQPLRTANPKEETISSCDTSPITNYRGCGEVKKFTDKIVGGKIAEKNSNPWIALIFKEGKEHCGGTLITNQHVVSAAHCFVDEDQPTPTAKEYVVRLAEHDTSTTADGTHAEMGVARIKIHEEYGLSNKANDIAIMKLKRTVCFNSRVRPACLPTSMWNSLDLTAFKPYVAGWGFTEKLELSEILLTAQLKVLTTNDCREKYRRYSKEGADKINDKVLCAGDAKGEKDSCNGDSGGPLILADAKTDRHYLIGIVSGGPSKCGNAAAPGIYARVSFYFDWINKNVN